MRIRSQTMLLNVRCVLAQAFCSQKSFREITLKYAKVKGAFFRGNGASRASQIPHGPTPPPPPSPQKGVTENPSRGSPKRGGGGGAEGGGGGWVRVEFGKRARPPLPRKKATFR